MGKKLFVPCILSCTFLCLLGINPVWAADKGNFWDSPWKDQAKLNLWLLINDGYKVVGINNYNVGNTFFETIHVQKGNSLYRCFTATGFPEESEK